MPWEETSVMDERRRFVVEFQRGFYTMTELCERYGVPRMTGYKWVERFEDGGPPGLRDLSRAPHHQAQETDPELVDALLQCRRKHPTWGPRKLLKILEKHFPHMTWPAPSTVGGILKRNGLILPRRRRPKVIHPGRPTTDYTGPNDIWAADFKGEFLMGNGAYCYSLTVTDGFTRYLLACKALPSTEGAGAIPVFKRLIRTYGLPSTILTDNGAPFATTGLHRLSRLSVWWIKLGIQPLLIEPGHPEQNGRHERMHRTLKKEATKPPKDDLARQQREFNRFRAEYNDVRPHEAIDMKTPASCYQASPRPFPERIEPFDYPDHFKVRKVSTSSSIRWNHRPLSISRTLIGEYVAFEEIDDGLFSVFFRNVLLGRFDSKHWKLHA